MKNLLYSLALSSMLFFSASVHAETQPALIKVSSFAEKNVDPNIMNVNLSLWGKGSTAAAAQELSAKQMKRIKDLVEKFKIKKDDFETQSYSVTPDYSYEHKTGKRRIQGYNAVQTLKVVFKNLDQAGQFIDQVADGDPNDKSGTSVYSIDWDSDKKAQAEEDCIEQAVKSGRSRADELAKAAGVKIKGVYMISNQQVYSNYQGEAMEAAMDQGASFAKSSRVSTQLNPGKIKVRADVSLEYLIQN